jgi:hypothetical protein
MDLSACVWCSQRSVKCSISLRGKGGGEVSTKRKRNEDGKGKGKAREEDRDDLAGNAEAGEGEVVEDEERVVKKARVQGELEDDKVRESLEEVPIQIPRKAAPPATINDLVSSIQELVMVCRDGFAEVREARIWRKIGEQRETESELRRGIGCLDFRCKVENLKCKKIFCATLKEEFDFIICFGFFC